MADIIDLTSRLQGRNNLLAARPIEFRRGEWQGSYAALCPRKESERYEEKRLDALPDPDALNALQPPNHVSLDEGYHYTVTGLFRYRKDEEKMRRVYRLAGLMECVTNISSLVLRSDLLRRFYQLIIEERDSLDVVWRGNAQHFLLPLDPDLYNPNVFQYHASTADTLMNLYDVIEVETRIQFDILCLHYVIYLPMRVATS